MKKFCQNLQQIYGDMKLQSKITLVMILAVTVPVLFLGIFLYGRLYDMIVSYTISQEQDASSRTAPIIEDTVQKVLDTYTDLSNLPFFQALFHMPVNTPFSELAASRQAEEFRKQTEKMTDGTLITGVQIYADLPSEASVLFQYKNTETIFHPVSYIKGTYWYGIFQGSHHSELYCPSFYLGTQEKLSNGDMAYIRSNTIYYHGEAYPCYVAVYYSSELLTKILTENLEMEGSVSYIINDRNSLVASSDESLSGIYWLDYQTIKNSFTSNNFIERTILGSKIYAGFYDISQPDWCMVTVLPSAPLMEESNTIMVQYVLFYAGFLLLAFLLANLLARSITNRISSVISQMRLVREGPPVPMESPRYHDEVGDLIDTYNYMTRTMAKLIEDQGKAAEDLRIAEFNSLQAQINPHFLYNTMDMINWLAQQGRNSEVCNAVQNLSKFYKLTLSRKQSISTIAKEEEHVSIYIYLQNMRYHGRISFISDIPDELMEYQIPKLTLQPIIENAILHGILEKDTKSGTIVLTGWMEDEDIILLISDDGVGIPGEKLPTILSGTGSSSSGGTNIAVYNTHRRMQILYGPRYGLTYSSSPGQGTEVQIRIPAQKEYENPYVHTSRAYTSAPLLPLITISDRETASSIRTASPETLLEYSQKLTQNLYNIQNLHQVFETLPRDENLYILSHEVTADFPNHTHDYFELNYVCSGSLINVLDGNEIYMSEGDLVFVNPKAVQTLRYQQPETLLVNFCLKPELFERTLKAFCEKENLISAFLRGEQPEEKNYIFFSLGHSLHAQSILTSIIQEYADNGFHQSFSLEAYFLLLFSYLVSAEEYSYYGTDGKTHQMIQYLKEHCMWKDLDTISGHFQCTLQQFDTHLKKHTGRSCRSFVEEVRLDKAVSLMANPDLNIYQIVESCGYRDGEEFFESFHRKFHVSPTEYRKQFL